jgi:hypothetical protein
MKRLVEVHWIDSSASNEWTYMENYTPKLAPITSIGWTAYEDDNLLAVAPHDGRNQANGIMVIPKCSIKECYEIIIRRKKK